MPYDFLVTTPTDTEDFGTDLGDGLPPDERLHRVAVKGAWEEEHDMGTGFHTFQVGDDTAEDAVVGPLAGQIFLRSDSPNPGIDHRTAAGAWEQIASLIPAGTVWDFYQNAAPNGWAFLAGQGDSLQYLASVVTDGGAAGPAASTPTYGSDWDFTDVGVSGTDEGHALASGEMPAHSHTVDKRSDLGSGPPTDGGTSDGGTQVSGETGGGAEHKHDLSVLGTIDNTAGWRPTHNLWIPCTKAAAGV